MIGKGALINSHTILTSWQKVFVGDDTHIAPVCHITDRVHGVCKDISINEQLGDVQPIKIGCDVWIASSCIVLKGVTIGYGAIVGANSVVNIVNWNTEEFLIYA